MRDGGRRPKRDLPCVTALGHIRGGTRLPSFLRRLNSRGALNGSLRPRMARTSHERLSRSSGAYSNYWL